MLHLIVPHTVRVQRSWPVILQCEGELRPNHRRRHNLSVTRRRKVRNRRNLVARAGPGEGPQSLRVFGRLPFTGVSSRMEAGVRKAWKEETAGEFAPTLVSVYGEFIVAA
jgi:hypothetical protein